MNVIPGGNDPWLDAATGDDDEIDGDLDDDTNADAEDDVPDIFGQERMSDKIAGRVARVRAMPFTMSGMGPGDDDVITNEVPNRADALSHHERKERLIIHMNVALGKHEVKWPRKGKVSHVYKM